MPRNRRTRGRCVYCSAESQTADHVPPRCLFEQPRPQLITVPCCRRCNEAASKDDEYFRLVLTVHHKAGDHPDARGVRDAALRGIGHPKKRGFTRAFLSTLRPAEMRTPSGLYVGETAAFTVDLGRLGNVVRRVVRGLFYHHHGIALSSDAEVAAWAEDGLSGMPAADLKALHDTILAPVLAEEPRTIGRDVLRYWTAHDPADIRTSAWVLVFYGSVRFLAMTTPGGRGAESDAGI